jgi:uncharacterized protein with PQ loop repeat
MILIALIGSSTSYLQAYRMAKRQSSEDVSAVAYMVGWVVALHWLIYGLLKPDWLITLSSTIGLVGISTVLFLIFKQRYASNVDRPSHGSRHIQDARMPSCRNF